MLPFWPIFCTHFAMGCQLLSPLQQRLQKRGRNGQLAVTLARVPHAEQSNGQPNWRRHHHQQHHPAPFFPAALSGRDASLFSLSLATCNTQQHFSGARPPFLGRVFVRGPLNSRVACSQIRSATPQLATPPSAFFSHSPRCTGKIFIHAFSVCVASKLIQFQCLIHGNAEVQALFSGAGASFFFAALWLWLCPGVDGPHRCEIKESGSGHGDYLKNPLSIYQKLVEATLQLIIASFWNDRHFGWPTIVLMSYINKMITMIAQF